MDPLHRCCAGLDVHKQTVVACVRRLDPRGRAHQEVRTFGTMTCHLLALADWLADEGVTHVAMESTGVYWKPVFHLLEGRFDVLLVNAQHIKQVPGRKTDVKDCEWIAQLLQHGLLRASFVPPAPIRELRDLTRQRTQLVQELAAVANRIHKVLEDANIKLASVATDVLGASGRDMLEALIAGQTDPEQLADLARKRLREKIPALRLALQGRVTDHHRFLLRMHLDHVRHLEDLIGRLGARIGEVLAPFAEAAERLRTIPGVNQRVAETVVAEIGTNMHGAVPQPRPFGVVGGDVLGE
jgi:transposase